MFGIKYGSRVQALWLSLLLPSAAASAPATEVAYRKLDVKGSEIFYREAGDPRKQTIVLLHGFPSSSHMFRDLIADLGDEFHIIAPDYPGMGASSAPKTGTPALTFEAVADTMQAFLDAKNVLSPILYMQDFGGPVGMRLATLHPDRIAGLIFQNTPVSLEGWDSARLKGVQANAGPEPPEKRAAAKARVVPATDLYLYRQGARSPDQLNPDAWMSDSFALADPDKVRSMTDLQLDIPSNLTLYAQWQDYLRREKPKTLVVWGDRDPVFTPRGADDIKIYVPDAQIRHYDTGHFALEEEHGNIAGEIKQSFKN